MKKALVPALVLFACLFFAFPALADRVPSAGDLLAMVPSPETPLATDPAGDPLLRLVNRWKKLPSSFKPRVVKPRVKIKKNAEADLRMEAAAALESLFASAKAQGLSLIAVSGYRTYQMQKYIFARSVERNGEALASRMSAQAGASEHQLGLAADLSCDSLEGELSSRFARKKEGKWVAAHCAEYGFILRYKDEWADITGYQGEPWHIRFVGPDHAKAIAKMDVPLETYLDYLKLLWQQSHPVPGQ